MSDPLAKLSARMAAAAVPATPGLSRLRAESRAAFGKAGLPTRRVEAWKYSDLSHALEAPQHADETQRPPLTVLGASLGAFENGAYDAAASTLSGPDIVPLPRVLADAFSPFAE